MLRINAGRQGVQFRHWMQKKRNKAGQTKCSRQTREGRGEWQRARPRSLRPRHQIPRGATGSSVDRLLAHGGHTQVRQCRRPGARGRGRAVPPAGPQPDAPGGGGQGLQAAGRRRSISCLAHALAWARLRVDGFGPNGAAASYSGPDAVGASSGLAVRARMTSRKC